MAEGMEIQVVNEDIQLQLSLGDLIPMQTADNREILMRCTKTFASKPAIDLLPQARYRICLKNITEKWKDHVSSLLFQGLFVSDPDESGQVVAMNLTQRVLRLRTDVPLKAALVSLNPQIESEHAPAHKPVVVPPPPPPVSRAGPSNEAISMATTTHMSSQLAS